MSSFGTHFDFWRLALRLRVIPGGQCSDSLHWRNIRRRNSLHIQYSDGICQARPLMDGAAYLSSTSHADEALRPLEEAYACCNTSWTGRRCRNVKHALGRGSGQGGSAEHNLAARQSTGALMSTLPTGYGLWRLLN